jgi:hypothetical protein
VEGTLRRTLPVAKLVEELEACVTGLRRFKCWEQKAAGGTAKFQVLLFSLPRDSHGAAGAMLRCS